MSRRTLTSTLAYSFKGFEVGSIKLATHINLAAQAQFTVNVWAKLRVLTGNQTLYGESSDGSNTPLLWLWLTGGFINGEIRDDASHVVSPSGAVPTDGGWHMYTFARTATLLSVYFDGILPRGLATQQSASLGTTTTTNTYFGASDRAGAGPVNNWKGNVADVTVWKGLGMTAQQVLDLFHANARPAVPDYEYLFAGFPPANSGSAAANAGTVLKGQLDADVPGWANPVRLLA